MEEYIEQLRQTYASGQCYFTLLGTFSLIDICAAINSEDGKTNRTKFKDWYSTYLHDYLTGPFDGQTIFTASECYGFMCKILHQGRSEFRLDDTNPAHKTGKVAFTFGKGGGLHRCNSNGYYYLDLETFMKDVIAGVEEWLEDVKDVDHVQENLKTMVKITDQDPGKMVGSGCTFIV